MGNIPSLTHLSQVGSAKEETVGNTTTTEGQSEMNHPQEENPAKRALQVAPYPNVAASELDTPARVVTDGHAMTAPDNGQQQSPQQEGGPGGADKTMSPTTDYALALLRAASGPSDNFVISPFSLGASLAIILEGAKEGTQVELASLLGKNLTPGEVSALYSSLTTALAQKNPAVTTSIASRFFLHREFTLNASYQSRVQKMFNSTAENINFRDCYGSADYVNAFVKMNTGGMIPKLVEKSAFEGNSVALLATAFYFKGEWATSFKKEDTAKKCFHGVSGDRNELFMVASEVRTRYSLDEGLTVVSLTYKDPSYALVLLMPSENFGSWRANLTAEALQKALRDLGRDKIHIEFPKFKIESLTDGKTALQKCGVKCIFRDTGDLSAITDKRFHVGTIAHKAVIEISEEGTVAAAAAAEEYIILGCPPELVFDRPFLFVLLKDMKEILFVGQKA